MPRGPVRGIGEHVFVRTETEVNAVLALAAEGHASAAIARVTGIPRSTVRDWRAGRVPKRDGRAGAQRPCPICTPGSIELPPRDYVYLLGLYLGDGYISRGARTYCLRSSSTGHTQKSFEPAGRRSRRSGQLSALGTGGPLRAAATSSRCAPIIGPACFRNTGRAESTNERSRWPIGKRSSWPSITKSSFAVSFIAMAAASWPTIAV